MLCAVCGQKFSDRDPAEPCPHCSQPVLLNGIYRLDSVLSESAQSVTYRGTRVDDRLPVAIKELPFRALTSFRPMDRLRREAAILRQLDHPGIPAVLDELETGRGNRMSAWLVQSFVAGEDLERKLAAYRFDFAEVRALLRQLGEVLAYLHARTPPVVHRDVKPSNLIVKPDGGLALVDFGAVRDALRRGDETQTTVAGTFGYMAPEQLRGEALPASDVYSAGATALRLLTRKDPSASTDYAGGIKPAVLSSLPTEASALIQHLMAVDPAARPTDGQALLDRLEQRAPAVATASSTQAVFAQPGKWRVVFTPGGIVQLALVAFLAAHFFGVGVSLFVVWAALLALTGTSLRWTPNKKPLNFRRNMWAASACVAFAVLLPPLTFSFYGRLGLFFFGLPPAMLFSVLGYHFFTGTPAGAVNAPSSVVRSAENPHDEPY